MKWLGYTARAVAIVLLVLLLVETDLFAPILAPLNDNGAPAIYHQGSLLFLALNHLGLVALSTFVGGALALIAGIFVTRPAGAEFLPLSRAIVNIGQTFPPIAVLAIAVPSLGFGAEPTLLALTLYGLLPIFENTMAGLKNVPPTALDAARGMGMTGSQRLFQVELPLALPVILTGIRLSFVINLGTATIGSTVGAKSLGEVIMAGITTTNTAYILQGGIIVALLAVLIYDGLGSLERYLAKRTGMAAAR
ncbi:ABC transporter permease [Labrys miyagiensis]|uniref:ABC transporter permease n=1 Tax=Labrys miyagiensis TaxID=346912 RepID=A0ABQ6D0R4_9HYPH|nr:ABC transporter permease [Labrys miyagiensis]GLS24096.1 ABC transporter permease [Labrys miyagiensis]